MQNVASIPNAPPRPMVIPSSTRNLRACTKCHLLKTREQFISDGCNNCDYFDPDTPQRKREDIVDKNTTSSFEGAVAMITPGNGWVSNWQGIPRLCTILPLTQARASSLLVRFLLCCMGVRTATTKRQKQGRTNRARTR